MRTVGVIGLGLLGGALAERFLAAGLRVVGFDLREECRQRLDAAGGVPLPSSAAVAAAADVVVLSLPTGDVVASVLAEMAQAARGKPVIDTTTGDPDQTASLGWGLAGQGIAYLDATVVGSSRQARAGEFRSNLHRGGSASQVELSSREQEVAILAARTMQLNVAGVDLLRAKRGPLVLEVNSSPGLEGIEAATSVDVAGAIIDYICETARRRKRRGV